MGSSRARVPSSTSVMAATAAMGFDSEAMRKIASRGRGSASQNARVPMTSTWVAPPCATRAMSPGRSPRST